MIESTAGHQCGYCGWAPGRPTRPPQPFDASFASPVPDSATVEEIREIFTTPEQTLEAIDIQWRETGLISEAQYKWLLTHITEQAQKMEALEKLNQHHIELAASRLGTQLEWTGKAADAEAQCALMSPVVEAARRINYGVLISKLLDANVVLPEITLRLSTLANAVGDLTALDAAQEPTETGGEG